ncbi:hypothetical protein M406DRAFT_100630 [Cryphonectria parasitica EP155]|uniref:Uncharacterized protein n=1 Tax=Cryphonectria parasitica (strain ATCC 38755 / EP155) TaxID=660469 RepID=A0A9P4YBF2_CRYP1|nr:uncharacterized protein M406DRAFT_100630 [Cryphonectria parasitica EP155]KAF3769960.1 hypothetical protein M406DRAFT_100630 [Cryphonectria parasitica EP155]
MKVWYGIQQKKKKKKRVCHSPPPLKMKIIHASKNGPPCLLFSSGPVPVYLRAMEKRCHPVFTVSASSQGTRRKMKAARPYEAG